MNVEFNVALDAYTFGDESFVTYNSLYGPWPPRVRVDRMTDVGFYGETPNREAPAWTKPES